ncbi:hypothetical protein Q0M94_15575 [Deinococcus radiomollis]|uniref:hypothetical protein n=1 Tax=Deinococcus radiomollis TaxID=468916 RepID=UPI003891B85E
MSRMNKTTFAISCICLLGAHSAVAESFSLSGKVENSFGRGNVSIKNVKLGVLNEDGTFNLNIDSNSSGLDHQSTLKELFQVDSDCRGGYKQDVENIDFISLPTYELSKENSAFNGTYLISGGDKDTWYGTISERIRYIYTNKNVNIQANYGYLGKYVDTYGLSEIKLSKGWNALTERLEVRNFDGKSLWLRNFMTIPLNTAIEWQIGN